MSAITKTHCPLFLLLSCPPTLLLLLNQYTLWHAVRQADIISRGHSGYNTRWALPVFDQVLKQQQGQKVLLLTIWLGANDAAIPDRSA